ncbi:MAG: ribosome biogenesis GTPase YqeH [Traorella sp.]
MRKCQGCGASLQTENPKLIGYTPKSDALVCQRCFRLKHYNDVMVSYREGIEIEDVLNEVNRLNALICFVVDLFDFEAGLFHRLMALSKNKDILLVASKRDLLPKTMGYDKLSKFIMKRCKEEGIDLKGVVIVEDLVYHAQSENNPSLENLRQAIDILRNGRDVVLMGMANAGKSTLLNGLLGVDRITTSAHPGTTLDLIEIDYDGYKLYDTPGLRSVGSVLTYCHEKDLKTIIPYKTIKPVVYQLKGNQSLSLGGLARIDLWGCEDVSCTVYVSNELKIHRGKAENGADLWKNHLGKDLVPCLSMNLDDLKQVTYQGNIHGKDIVIYGCGFVCVHGLVKKVDVVVDKRVSVTFRERMI